MKAKQFITLLAVASCLSGTDIAYGQYNYSYTDGNGKSIDIVNASYGGTAYSCVLGQGPTDPIILKKLDFLGNVIFDVGFYLNIGSLDIRPTKLLHTANDEYIVVGIGIQNGVYNPFAARFDASGNFLWFNLYNSNPGSAVTYNQGSLAMANVCTVQDDPSIESYIITATGADPFRNGSSGLDEFTNALRIDGSGNLMWNRKYFPASIPFGTSNNDVRENPEALVYVNPSGYKSRYFIAGKSAKLLTSGTSYLGFFMSIDKLGNIIDPYQETGLPTPRHHCAIFDNATNQVVFSYTCSNRAVPSSISGSTIGLTRVMAATGLTVTQSDFWAVPNSNENGGIWLTQNAANTQYVIACEIYDRTSGGVSLPGSMGILSINKTSPTPVIFNDYDYLRESQAAAIIDLTSMGMENYVMTGTPIPPGGGPNQMRVISTDVIGNACGQHALLNAHGGENISTVSYTYNIRGESGKSSYSLSQETFSGNFTSCMLSGNPDLYKKPITTTATVNGPEISVYPTLINAESSIAIDLNADRDGIVSIKLSDISGRTIYSKSVTAVQGMNRFTTDVANLPAGTYILNISQANSAINKTVKLSKL